MSGATVLPGTMVKSTFCFRSTGRATGAVLTASSCGVPPARKASVRHSKGASSPRTSSKPRASTSRPSRSSASAVWPEVVSLSLPRRSRPTPTSGPASAMPCPSLSPYSGYARPARPAHTTRCSARWAVPTSTRCQYASRPCRTHGRSTYWSRDDRLHVPSRQPLGCPSDSIQDSRVSRT